MLTIMKIRAAVAALAAILILSGCTAAPQTDPTPSGAEEAPAVEESSTVAQWASLIAQQKASWEDWETSWNDASCSGVTAGAESGGMCRLQLMSAMYMTQTTEIEYELATGPGKQGFIAEAPPSEIADLFSATQDSATAAREASAAWDAAGCSLTGAGECGALAVSFDRAIGDLTSQFDAWGPYL